MDLLGQGVHKQQVQNFEAFVGPKKLNYLLVYVGMEQLKYGLHLMVSIGQDQYHQKIMRGMMFVGLKNVICLLLHLGVVQQIK